jgi:hypothetical protein
MVINPSKGRLRVTIPGLHTQVDPALGSSKCNPDASEIPLAGIIAALAPFANAKKRPVAKAVYQELAHPLLSSSTMLQAVGRSRTDERRPAAA